MTDKTSSVIPPLLLGDSLGSFEILRLLGHDGQAQVYLARAVHERQMPTNRLLKRMKWFGVTPEFVAFQRLCAIKLANPNWQENVRDEHSYLLRIQRLTPEAPCPRLVRLYTKPNETTSERIKGLRGIWFITLTTTDGKNVELPYIALEYAAGGSLKELLERRRRKPLPPSVAVTIALQVAETLDYLHTQAQLVHHDIAPSNIVFRRTFAAHWWQQPDCMLIDLAVADSPVQPRLRKIYGRKTYLPPERLSDPPAPISWSIDVYSLGVVLYEMLVGQLPRTGTNAITNAPLPLPAIRDQHPHLSASLGSLVMSAVDHQSENRPTLQQLIAELQKTPEAQTNRGLISPRLALVSLVGLVGVFLLLIILSGMLNQDNGTSGLPTFTPVPSITPIPNDSPTYTPTPIIVPTSTPMAVCSELPFPLDTMRMVDEWS